MKLRPTLYMIAFVMLSSTLFNLNFVAEPSEVKNPTQYTLQFNIAHAETTTTLAEAAPAPESADEIKEPETLDPLLAFLMGAGGLVSALIILFEMFLRAFPKKNPKSLLVPVRYFCVSLAKILTFVGELCDKLIVVANNVKKS